MTLGLLVHLLRLDALTGIREKMRLNADSVVLLISTEGDTDPACYAEIVSGGQYPSPLL